jgi:ribonucleoside-diphosphate reductase subunit M1
VTKVVTKNLNKVIDVNFYPVIEAKNSNFRHRPIGIGVQGLADAFARMRLPFECPAAMQLNKDIFETMYFASLEASCEIAEKEGAYSTYEGSPMSKGVIQPDMWGVVPSDRWDWAGLRAKIAIHGVRNSLLMAPMPTASTAQIMGNNESTEPFTSNMYNRRVLAGEFTIVNKYLLKDLVERGVWTPEVRNQIIGDRGSVQNVSCLSQEIKVFMCIYICRSFLYVCMFMFDYVYTCIYVYLYIRKYPDIYIYLCYDDSNHKFYGNTYRTYIRPFGRLNKRQS